MKAATLVGFLLVLVGCVTTGTEPPQSFHDRLAYAVGIYKGVERTVEISVENKSMDPSNGDAILKQAETAMVVLETAKAADEAGDVAGADTKLATALVVLNALQSYLNAQGGKT